MTQALISVNFYTCPPQPPCLPIRGSSHLFIEEMGWESFSPNNPTHRFTFRDLQKAFDTFEKYMEVEALNAHAEGLCRLPPFSSRLFQGLKGCIKITPLGCIKLQSYILDSLRAFSATCLKAIRAWNYCAENGQCEVKNPAEICSKVPLPEMRSDALTKEIIWENPDKTWYTNYLHSCDLLIQHIFSHSLSQDLSVMGREVSCENKVLSATIPADAWEVFQDSNPQGVLLRIKYVLLDENNELRCYLFLSKEGEFNRRYVMKNVEMSEEEAVQLGERILKLDEADLKDLHKKWSQGEV